MGTRKKRERAALYKMISDAFAMVSNFFKMVTEACDLGSKIIHLVVVVMCWGAGWIVLPSESTVEAPRIVAMSLAQISS